MIAVRTTYQRNQLTEIPVFNVRFPNLVALVPSFVCGNAGNADGQIWILDRSRVRVELVDGTKVPLDDYLAQGGTLPI